MTRPTADSRAMPRVLFNVLLLLCAIVFLALRLPWREHLLMWDEAMNLCAVRAFVGGGHDPYSEWFWRYPPVFHLMMAAMQPLADGYAGRVSWIPIVLGLASLLTLAVVNRRLFGERIALLSCLAFAVMPGAVFYGVWIKQDAAAILFGLLSLLACVCSRPALAGCALGLAILSKQTAAFFAIAVGLLLLFDRRWRDLAVVVAISALTSLWWYFVFAPRSGKITAAVLAGAEACWIHPWHYYFGTFVKDLGWFGIGAAVCGMVALMMKPGMRRWPLALVLPALAILSAANCKTPWYAMMLFPALATLQAVGIGALAVQLVRCWPLSASFRLASSVAVAALAVLLAQPMLGRSYENMMAQREPMMWEASHSSRQAAETLNICVKPGQSALITTMHYYGTNIGAPCPIFVIYLKDMPVLIRRHDSPPDGLIDDMRANRLDWAMVSPAPGPTRERMLHLLATNGCNPLIFRDVIIFSGHSLHTTPVR